jgi:hypothetical protein
VVASNFAGGLPDAAAFGGAARGLTSCGTKVSLYTVDPSNLAAGGLLVADTRGGI